MSDRPAEDVLPRECDLPGTSWLAIDEGFGSDAPAANRPGELIDCVGPEFPEDDVIATAATPHYLRPPGRLVHGFAVTTSTLVAALAAESILSGLAFAECLGRSVAVDLDASGSEAELLAVDVESTDRGHRVRFTGGTGAGVRPVQLDVVCLRLDTAVGLLWFADTPNPFPAGGIEHVVGRILAR